MTKVPNNRKEWEVNPLTGIGPLKLGMSRTELHTLLGEPEDSFQDGPEEPLTDTWFEEQLFVFYTATEAVDYIEVHGFRSKYLMLELAGKDVFTTKAGELVDHIEKKGMDAYLRESPELPYGYIFPGIALSLYRPFIPMEYEKDEQDDGHGKGHYFETLGLGVQGYFDEELN